MKTTKDLRNKIDYKHIANQFNSAYKEANANEINDVKINSEITIQSFELQGAKFDFVIILYKGREFAEVYKNDELEKSQTITANQNIDAYKDAAAKLVKS